MNRKVLQNKSFLMAHSFNRTKMFHSKKGWLISSALILAMLGVATNASHAQVHADVNKLSNQQAKPTNPVQNKTSDKSTLQTSTSSAPINQKNVASQASQMHAGLMKLGLSKPTSSVASSSSSSASKPSAKPISESSAPSSSNDMTTLKLGTRSQQAKVWNYVQHGLKNNDFDNYKPSSSSTSLTTKPASSTASSMASVKSSSASSSSSNAPKQVPNIHHNILGTPNPLETNPSNVTKSGQQPVIKHNLGATNYVTDTITLHDIYGDVDGMQVPTVHNMSGRPSDTYSITQGKLIRSNGIYNMLDSDWAVVNPDGTPCTKTFKYGDGNQVVDVAPIVNGMTYKYNASTQSLTFMNGSLELYGGQYHDLFSDIQLYDGQNFPSLKNIKSISFNNVDVSKIHNMNGLLSSNKYLQSIDLGNHFDTSQVTDMGAMFIRDSNLQSLNLGNHFDTGQVTNMSGMFDSDSNLQSLNLGNHFDTGQVTNMSGMFQGTGLKNLVLPDSFDTSRVNDMSQMFQDSALESITFDKNFNTEHAIKSEMISANPYLTTITIASPNTKLGTRIWQVDEVPQALDNLTVHNRHQLVQSITRAENRAKNHINDNSTVSDLIRYARRMLPKRSIQELRPCYSDKLSEFNHGNLSEWYKKDASDDYTSAKSVDLSRGGNVGTFTPFRNVPTNSGTNSKPVQRMPVNGRVTIHLVYRDTSDASDPESDDESDNTPTINIGLGRNKTTQSSDMIISPWDYAKDGYKVISHPFIIHFGDALKKGHKLGRRLIYMPKITFTYIGYPAGSVTIKYYDTDPGAQSMGQGTYNGMPIVGTHTISDSDLGVAGRTIKLTPVGSHIGQAVLQAPNGFHFVNNNIEKSIFLRKQPTTLMLGMSLGASKPNFLPQHHTSTNSSATTTPIQPANIPSSTTSSASSASVIPSSANSTSPVITTPTSNNEATPAPVNKNFVVEPKHQTLPQSNNTTNTNPITSDNSTSTPTTSTQPIQKPKTIHKYVFVHVPSKHHTPMLAQQTQIPSRNDIKQVPQITLGDSAKLAQIPNKEVQSSSTNSTTPTPIQANTLTPTNNHSYSNNNTVTTSKHSPEQLPQTDENATNNSLFAIAIIMFSLGLAGVDLKHQFNN